MLRRIKWLLVPTLVGVTASLLVTFFVKTDVLINNLEFVLNSIILCAATFSGFILTSLSILLGLSTRPVMQDLKQGTGLDELKTLYSCALVLGFILIIVCVIIGAIVSFTDETQKGVIVIGVGLICAYFTNILITGYALLAIMNLLSKDKPIVIENAPRSPEVIL